MTDVHNKSKRSYNMSMIKAKNTKPELILRKHLHKHGFRFRLYNPNLPGHPDVILSKYRTIIFVNGCFWHGHQNCRNFKIPKTNTEWWLNKISRTKLRDINITKQLKNKGWNVITIWECELKPQQVENTIQIVIHKIQNSSNG